HPLLQRRREAVLQDRAHDAVHDEVRVAPDRAREVQVVLERQAVVAEVLAGVARLLEAPQQQGADELRLGLTRRLPEDGLQVLRAGVLEVERVPETRQRLLQREHLDRKSTRLN